jgi:hypothetical protein
LIFYRFDILLYFNAIKSAKVISIYLLILFVIHNYLFNAVIQKQRPYVLFPHTCRFFQSLLQPAAGWCPLTSSHPLTPVGNSSLIGQDFHFVLSVSAPPYKHTWMHAYIYIHTYIYTYIHTYIHTSPYINNNIPT